MTIKPGEKLPQTTFRTHGADGPANITSDEIFAGKTVILFAVPGAFTPTCNNNHLPGFLEENEALRGKGVDTIAVVSVNDVFVMDAWAKTAEAGDRILFLADGNADFTRSIGMEQDLSVKGYGIRSKRYSMLVRDGVVQSVNTEEAPGQADKSSAQTILDQL